jgi:hypothetical protein
MGSRNGSKSGPKRANGTRKVELDPEELRTLLAACEMYRHSVPCYLASRQPELRLLKTVMRKLS